MSNANNPRYQIYTMRNADGKRKRFCDIVKDDETLFIETKQGKEIRRIDLRDFLCQLNVAEDELNPKKLSRKA